MKNVWKTPACFQIQHKRLQFVGKLCVDLSALTQFWNFLWKITEYDQISCHITAIEKAQLLLSKEIGAKLWLQSKSLLPQYFTPPSPCRKTLIKSPQDRNQGDPPLSSQLIAPQIAVTVGSRKNAWLHVNFCQRTGWTCWLASIRTAGSTRNLRDTTCHSFSSAAIGK